MNWTNFEHALFAVLIQLSLFPVLGWVGAGAVAIAFLAGREYAQVEYKVRNATGRSLTKMMPWHLRPKYWSLDTVLDVLIPVIAVTAVVFIVRGFL